MFKALLVVNQCEKIHSLAPAHNVEMTFRSVSDDKVHFLVVNSPCFSADILPGFVHAGKSFSCYLSLFPVSVLFREPGSSPPATVDEPDYRSAFVSFVDAADRRVSDRPFLSTLCMVFSLNLYS